MTSFMVDYDLFLAEKAVSNWKGSDLDVKNMLDFRLYDNRKWLLIKRLIKNGKFTKELFEKIKARDYRPPTVKQLIKRKKQEVLSLYEDSLVYASVAAYPEECKSDYESWLEEAINKSQSFEKSYGELIAMDPSNSITNELKQIASNSLIITKNTKT